MRIFCTTCKEHILNTSGDFILGGEYHGGMFSAPSADKWHSHVFDCREHTKGGDMWCPRCTGRFLGPKEEILTEHGVVKPGQESLDTSFNLVWADGPARGQLMYVKDSLEMVRDGGPRTAPDRKTTEKTNVKWMTAAQIKRLYPTPAGPEENSNNGSFMCPKCGKVYLKHHKRWFDKHVEEGCRGA